MTNMRAIRRAHKRPLFRLRFLKRRLTSRKIKPIRKPNLWRMYTTYA